MIPNRTTLALALGAAISLANVVDLHAGYAEDWARMKGIAPRSYVCPQAPTPLQIDGRLDERAWKSAPWTDYFVDIEGGARPKPRLRTRAKMLWDDEFFYVASEMEEPHIWGTLTNHDAVIFHDPDFEVFIDPDGDSHDYYEFEMNALNTGWDLFLKKPYKDGGPALNEWEIPGLKTAVYINGTLNDPSDRDKGWTIEIAFPWKVLGEFANRPAPPNEGDQWRVSFSRVEWLVDIVDGKYRKVFGQEGGQLGLVATGHRRHASSGEVGLRPVHATRSRQSEIRPGQICAGEDGTAGDLLRAARFSEKVPALGCDAGRTRVAVRSE